MALALSSSKGEESKEKNTVIRILSGEARREKKKLEEQKILEAVRKTVLLSIERDPSLKELGSINSDLATNIHNFRVKIRPKGGEKGNSYPCSYDITKEAEEISHLINKALGYEIYREYPRSFFINPKDYI